MEVAPQYKNTAYIIFDNEIDNSSGNYENVYSITYKANEGAFLGGALASMVTTSDLERANPEKKIGFLGGADVPGINDFLVGYISGARYVDKETEVNVAYIGDFIDAAKGKDMSLSQYNQGVDISFNVAGPAGLGMIDAAADANKFVLGVDADQAMMFEETSKEKAESVVSSVQKNVSTSLERALELYFDDKLPLGTAENLGLKEGGVSLVKNKYFDEYLTQENKTILNEIEEKIISGEIVVDSAYGKTSEEIKAIINRR